MAGPVIFTVSSIAVKLLLLTVCSALAIIIHRLYLHPLARLPGPKLAAISNVWYAYHARNGRMLSLGKTLHNTYGPVVRVGHNEIWLDSKEAFSKIYSQEPVYVFSLNRILTNLQVRHKHTRNQTSTVSSSHGSTT